ncbi:SulP family inorganic anion transporter [Sulfuriroseicoccus oceanibius]|uniref:SulP family inorganic anion transporter n=1 Tax=Sulfuriroseicoccus oceanibius TaxID=2707525 RepID=A0A7T7F0I1_9BACT|nr:SulP family inorganic anion transporter [Sulfuriroseicoccus oceanibius]QQL44437.1 SulP family inorganic anion transporter [Sulfuriroseicoccus oceanibius]
MLSKGVRSTIKRAWQEFFGSSTIRMWPSLGAFKGYSRGALKADFGAGLNVALLGLPQGMAYAAVAGVDIVFGIMATAIAAVFGTFFSSARFTMLGPSNATAFMIYSFFVTYPGKLDQINSLIPLLSLMIGVVLILGAFLRAADLGQYISRSVIVGYLSGAAILIMVGQVKHVLGVQMVPEGGDAATDTPRSLFGMVWRLVEQVPNASWAAVSLGVGTIIVYLLLQQKWRRLPVFAITLVLGCLCASALATVDGLGFGPELARYEAFTPADLVPSSPFHFASGDVFQEMGALFGLALAVAFLASLEGGLMAKSMASRSGDRVDANQDLYGLGVANIACSLGGGMPSSASLTRSALNFESGARTALSAAFSGMLCLLGAVALSQMVAYIPKAVLAGLVIAVAVSLINRKNIRICLGATKSDATSLIVTFGATLVMPLHVAIFVGVTTSVMLYLRKAARPDLVEYGFTDDGNLAESSKRNIPAISIVHVEGDLFFGAADLFRSQIQRTLADENLKVIILRLRNARNLDATSVMALADLVREVNKRERHLVISGITKSIYAVLKNSGMIDVVGRDNIFLMSPENPNISTRNALMRAQELLGTAEADIQIYVDRNKERNEPS